MTEYFSKYASKATDHGASINASYAKECTLLLHQPLLAYKQKMPTSMLFNWHCYTTAIFFLKKLSYFSIFNEFLFLRRIVKFGFHQKYQNMGQGWCFPGEDYTAVVKITATQVIHSSCFSSVSYKQWGCHRANWKSRHLLSLRNKIRWVKTHIGLNLKKEMKMSFLFWKFKLFRRQDEKNAKLRKTWEVIGATH